MGKNSLKNKVWEFLKPTKLKILGFSILFILANFQGIGYQTVAVLCFIGYCQIAIGNAFFYPLTLMPHFFDMSVPIIKYLPQAPSYLFKHGLQSIFDITRYFFFLAIMLTLSYYWLISCLIETLVNLINRKLKQVKK